MAERVCPWWAGYLLASPVRKWMLGNPENMLAPFVRKGMTVLEPGPGMGFFTLPLARMVGPEGRVVAVDIQAKMLEGLRRRARGAGLHERIDARLAEPDRMGLGDLTGAVDLVLAFAVVHEVPSSEAFFRDVAATLKPGASLFLAEPAGHVRLEIFQQELAEARAAGLKAVSRPTIRRCLAAVLRKG